MSDESVSNFTKIAVATGVVVGTVLVKNALKPASVKVSKEGYANQETKQFKSDYSQGPYSSSDKTQCAVIRYAEKGYASEEGFKATTVPKMFEKAAKRKGDKPALRQEVGLPVWKKGDKIPPSKPLKEWKTWTFSQYYEQSKIVARAFINLGLKPFDAVTIFGFNSPEWFMAEMAAILAGGCAAGIYPTDTPNQVFFKARHSGASIAVVENDLKAKIFYDRQDELPDLKAVVIWSPDKAFKSRKEGKLTVTSWDHLTEFAKGTSAEELQTRIENQKPGNACSYVYTSGTTGDPKAVMITHDNILFASFLVSRLMPLVKEGAQERMLSYLPLSHVAGLMIDIISPIVMSALTDSVLTISFARVYDLKAGSFGDRLRAVKPTFFLGVPRVWEKVMEAMKSMAAKNPLTGVKLAIANWAKGKGLEHAMNCQMGGSGAKGFGYGFAQKKVLDVVRQKLGLDECRFGMTGAAPITKETLQFFGTLGIQINEVYGMSECTCATTWSSDDAHVWGSCGWEIPGMEVCVMDEKGNKCPPATQLNRPEEKSQGELCFRGRHIMLGYMSNSSLGEEHVKQIQMKNADAIDENGWLHSGDKGCMDSRGCVKITGRYKELIIGAGGENIAPVPIENTIKKLHSGISNVMMIGDKQKYNVAVITLKAKGANGAIPGTDELDGGALNINKGVTTISGASKDEFWIKSITDAIVATNKDEDVCVSNACKIQKFTILPHDFSVETGELTPTFKLKRSVAQKQLADIIEKLYSSKETYVPF